MPINIAALEQHAVCTSCWAYARWTPHCQLGAPVPQRGFGGAGASKRQQEGWGAAAPQMWHVLLVLHTTDRVDRYFSERTRVPPCRHRMISLHTEVHALSDVWAELLLNTEVCACVIRRCMHEKSCCLSVYVLLLFFRSTHARTHAPEKERERVRRKDQQAGRQAGRQMYSVYM